jgi:hypothetical protein
MPRFVVALSALLLALLAASTAQATSALALSTPEQAALSAAVVLATVGSATQEVHPTLQRPVTVTELRIERVLLGSAPAAVAVRQWRGELDGRSSFIPGDPELYPGVRLVVFLRQVDGRWFLTALSQSVFRVGSGADPSLEREVDVALFTRAADGRLLPLEQPLDEPSRLSSLEAVLSGVRPRGPESTQ